jgi:hypothetical protein
MKNKFGGDQQNTSYRLPILFFKQVTFPIHEYVLISDAVLQIA